MKKLGLLIVILLVTTLAGAQYREAPMLAKRVKAGELPPVNQRLPRNPLLIKTVQRTGVYGGTWHMGLKGNRDHALLIRTMGYEGLVRWSPKWTKIIPNLAQSVKVSKDAREYRFKLRKGVHWSDGVPFSVDDILFWYEDVLSNPELTPAPPTWLTTGRDPVQVKKIDASTVVFRFKKPNGLFLRYMAKAPGVEPTSYPKHYLKQFHSKYNPNIAQLVQKAGVKNWVELFQHNFGEIGSIDHPSRWRNPDLPTLNAWILKNGYLPDAPKVTAERNPYYWKIDSKFNQLPYIDQVEYKVGKNKDTLIEWALAGKIDMQQRHITSETLRSKYQAHQKQGNYHFYNQTLSRSNQVAIGLNLTHPRPWLRKVFQNKNFRIGLSHAINRQKIIDQVYAGNGKPYQVAPRPESAFFHKRLAYQYTEYDVALANQYLDRAGYSKRDAKGIRLDPGGKPIAFTVEISSNQSSWHEVMKLVRQDWRHVGIDASLAVKDRKLFYEYKAANKHDAAVWWGTGGLDVLLEPRHYFPVKYESNFAIPWAYWYVNPKDPNAQEPPDIVKQQMKLYDQLTSTGDTESQIPLMRKILDIAADQYYVIGINLSGDNFGIVKNNFHNVPTVMPASWTYPDPAPTNPSQYFITPE